MVIEPVGNMVSTQTQTEDNLRPGIPNSIEVDHDIRRTDRLRDNDHQRSTNLPKARVTSEDDDRGPRNDKGTQHSDFPCANGKQQNKRKGRNRRRNVGQSSNKECPTDSGVLQANNRPANLFQSCACTSPERSQGYGNQHHKPKSCTNWNQAKELLNVVNKCPVERCDDDDKAFSEPRQSLAHGVSLECPERHRRLSATGATLDASHLPHLPGGNIILLTDKHTQAKDNVANSTGKKGHSEIHDDRLTTAGFRDIAESAGQRVADNTVKCNNLYQEDSTHPKKLSTQDASQIVRPKTIKGGHRNHQCERNQKSAFQSPQRKPKNHTRAKFVEHSSKGAGTTSETHSIESNITCNYPTSHIISKKETTVHSNSGCSKMETEPVARGKLNKSVGPSITGQRAKLISYLSECHVDRNEDCESSISLPTLLPSQQIPPPNPPQLRALIVSNELRDLLMRSRQNVLVIIPE